MRPPEEDEVEDSVPAVEVCTQHATSLSTIEKVVERCCTVGPEESSAAEGCTTKCQTYCLEPCSTAFGARLWRLFTVSKLISCLFDQACHKDFANIKTFDADFDANQLIFIIRCRHLT